MKRYLQVFALLAALLLGTAATAVAQDASPTTGSPTTGNGKTNALGDPSSAQPFRMSEQVAMSSAKLPSKI